MKCDFQIPNLKINFLNQMQPTQILYFNFVLALFAIMDIVNSQCCLKFNGSQCITCPENMHIYRGNCIYDIPNCKTYSNGFDCLQCNQGFKFQISVCNKVPIIQPSQIAPPAQNTKMIQTSTNPVTQQSPSTQAKQYKEVAIALPLDPTSSQDTSSRASVVEEIFRSNYHQIRSAEIVKASDRIYPNGTKHICLEFRTTGKNQETYQGVMIADLEAFIFKEVIFQKVELTLVLPQNQDTNPVKSNGNQSNSNTTVATNQTFSNQSSNGRSSAQNSKPTEVSSINSGVQTNTSQSNKNTSTNVPSGNTEGPRVVVKSQAKYQTLKFVEMSDTQALMEISFVVCLNQINNEVKQLQGVQPKKIYCEEGYNNTKNPLKLIHYIIHFDKSQTNTSYEVRLKIDVSSFQVTIDDVLKKDTKQSNSPQSNNSTPRASGAATPIKSLDGEILVKSNFTQISADPSHADIFFLIFLDNVGKTLQKILIQNGQKPGQNQIIFAGKFQVKDQIYFWVETKVTCSVLTKKTYRVQGIQNKLNYEVNITEITLLQTEPLEKVKPLEPIQPLQVKNSSNTSNQVVSNGASNQGTKTNTTSTSLGPNVEVDRQIRQSKDILIEEKNNSTSSSPVPASKPPISVSSSSISTSNSSISSTSVVSSGPSVQNSTLPLVIPASVVQTPIPVVVETPTPAVQTPTPPSATTVSNQNPVTVLNVQNQTVKSNISTLVNTSNLSNQNSSNTTMVASNVETKLPGNNTNSSVNIEANKSQTKPSASIYSTPEYGQVNSTIYEKSSGFEEIQSAQFINDQGVQRVVQTLLNSRSGRQNRKLYKVFIKNFGIKAEYKIYFIDNTTNPSKIETYEGYATFDLMRKRVFVIMFASIG